MMDEFEIIEDEPADYPEKPKRKGKPVNWHQVAEWAMVILSIALGTFVVGVLLVGAFMILSSAMNRLEFVIFPDGMRANKEFDSLLTLFHPLGVFLGINMVVGFVAYFINKAGR